MSLGFIGTGVMGEPMCRNLAAKSGQAVIAYDRAAGPLERLRALLDAGGSMILRVCLNPIIAVLRDSAPLRRAIYAKPETNLIGWRALGVWIDKPDATTIPVLLGVLAERDRATVKSLEGSRR